jgi:hypothetical protein
MNTVIKEAYFLNDLNQAISFYKIARTKKWLGVCWYEPNDSLFLDLGDETLFQVGELLSCTRAEAELVLKLLKVSGAHITFAVRVKQKKQEIEERFEDEEEEFDEEGWLVGSSKKKKQSFYQTLFATGEVGHRYLGVLSCRGLRKQVEIISRDGWQRNFFPVSDKPILSEYALWMAERYENKTLQQVRFLLRLQIYYLAAFCRQGEKRDD